MKKVLKSYEAFKRYLKRMNQINKGELSYEAYEKLESKKYPFNPPRCEEIFMRHHTYPCTNECFRNDK